MSTIVNLNTIIKIKSFITEIKNYIEKTHFYFEKKENLKGEIFLSNGKTKKTTIFLQELYFLYMDSFDKKTSYQDTMAFALDIRKKIEAELSKTKIVDKSTLIEWKNKLKLILPSVENSLISISNVKIDVIYNFSKQSEIRNAYKKLVDMVSKNELDGKFLNEYYKIYVSFVSYLNKNISKYIFEEKDVISLFVTLHSVFF